MITYIQSGFNRFCNKKKYLTFFCTDFQETQENVNFVQYQTENISPTEGSMLNYVLQWWSSCMSVEPSE